MSAAQAFESALRANPDDLAGWCAYADYLAERGDPRGEFMQTQIALEDEDLPKEEREELKKKEAALLKEHEREWVGSWADVVAAPEGNEEHRGEWNPTDGKKYEFHRGWITTLNVGELLVREARAIVAAPELRFVRNLFIGDVNYCSDAEYDSYRDPDYAEDEEPEPDELDGVDYPSQFVLLRWPQLRQIRRFHIGWPVVENYGEQCPYNCLIASDQVFNFVAQMPNLEELYCFVHCVDTDLLFPLPMPRLRALQLYHLHNYPLEKLAENPTLTRLESLRCHPGSLRRSEAYIRLNHLQALCRSPHMQSLTHLQLRLTDFGDLGAKEVVDSGALKRLKILDLRHGCMTDEGAKLLAASSDLRHLDFLDVSHNALTKEGINAIRTTGIRFYADHQHGQGPGYTGRDFHYLEAGDYE